MHYICLKFLEGPLARKEGLHKLCIYTVDAVIFEGHKFCGFCCKLAVREILILEKKYWLKEIIYQLDQ